MSEVLDNWQVPISITDVHEIAVGVGLQTENPEIQATVTREFDIWRLQNGFACMYCYTPFPARPSAITLKHFEPMRMWGPNYQQSKERIKQGFCPICGCEVSPEMYETLLVEG